MNINVIFFMNKPDGSSVLQKVTRRRLAGKLSNGVLDKIVVLKVRFASLSTCVVPPRKSFSLLCKTCPFALAAAQAEHALHGNEYLWCRTSHDTWDHKRECHHLPNRQPFKYLKSDLHICVCLTDIWDSTGLDLSGHMFETVEKL